ncbi:MAG: hypothetical protein QXU47_06825 [Candidatus Bathyarchaeia archaeon]
MKMEKAHKLIEDVGGSGLGMGLRNDEGYVQCPDPEPPYTKG